MLHRWPLSVIALLVTTPLAAAEPAASAPISRDGLRACMDRSDALTAQRAALAAQQEEHERALAAHRTAGDALAREQAALDHIDAKQVAAFEAKAAAHNARGAELDARTAAQRDEARRFNAAMAAHNARCGGIVFRAEDRAAILAEREEQRKKAEAPR